MEQRKPARPSRPVAAKRLPSDTTAPSTPRKRPSGSHSQRPPTTSSIKNRNAPLTIPTSSTPTPLHEMTASRQEGNRGRTKVATPKLPQPTPTSTPFLAKRIATISRDLMMKARTMQMSAHRANGVQPGPLPRNRDRGRSYIPVDSGGNADLSSLRMTPSRSLLYTTQTDHKIPSSSIPTLATSTNSPRPGPTLPAASRSQQQTERRHYTPVSNAGAQLPHGYRLPVEVSSQSTQRADDTFTADVSITSNGETPSRNAVQTSRPTNQGDMRAGAIATKFPKNRRRPVVVDDEEVLTQLPTASHQPTRKHYLSPNLSASPQPLAQRASELIVPPELEGVRSAMGDHDWRTFVGLMESLIDGGITKGEFEMMAGRIFQMGNKKMEKKVWKMTYGMIRGIDT